MLTIQIFNAQDKPKTNEKNQIIDFLYENLEKYRDSKTDIEKAINYSIKETPSFGGFILVSYYQSAISGVVVINQTGMQGYIPENILVYIATRKELRGRGIGKKLIQKTMSLAKGNIALHVEPDNPAKFLYEKTGFTNKYLEMRLIR